MTAKPRRTPTTRKSNRLADAAAIVMASPNFDELENWFAGVVLKERNCDRRGRFIALKLRKALAAVEADERAGKVNLDHRTDFIAWLSLAAGHTFIQQVTDDVVREIQSAELSAPARHPNRQQAKKPAKKRGPAAKRHPRPKRKE